MLGKRRRKIYLGVLISAACIWWLARSIEPEQLLSLLADANLPLLLVAVVVMTLGYYVRSWRWRYFFSSHAPSQGDAFRVLILGFFMNNVLPARLGEIARAQFGGHVTKLSRAHVLGTIAGERLADGLTISAFFGLLFSLFATAQESSRGGEVFVVAYLFLGASVVTAIILMNIHWVFKLLEKLDARFPGKISKRGFHIAKRFLEGLDSLRIPKNLAVVTILSLVVWGIELVVYFLIALAFKCQLNLGELSLFLAAVNFSSLVPAAPGGIGVIEAFASFALVQIGVGREVALAMVAVQHFIQILVVGVPGIVFFLKYMHGKLVTGDEMFEPEDSERVY